MADGDIENLRRLLEDIESGKPVRREFVALALDGAAQEIEDYRRAAVEIRRELDTIAGRLDFVFLRSLLADHYEPAEALDWLFTPHPQLDSKPPIYAIAEGNWRGVVAALQRLDDSTFI